MRMLLQVRDRSPEGGGATREGAPYHFSPCEPAPAGVDHRAAPSSPIVPGIGSPVDRCRGPVVQRLVQPLVVVQQRDRRPTVPNPARSITPGTPGSVGR